MYIFIYTYFYFYLFIIIIIIIIFFFLLIYLNKKQKNGVLLNGNLKDELTKKKKLTLHPKKMGIWSKHIYSLIKKFKILCAVIYSWSSPLCICIGSQRGSENYNQVYLQRDRMFIERLEHKIRVGRNRQSSVTSETPRSDAWVTETPERAPERN